MIKCSLIIFLREPLQIPQTLCVIVGKIALIEDFI